MSLFYVYKDNLLKKISCQTVCQFAIRYELSAHLICLDNSYCLNTYADLFCMGVCCNSPCREEKW